MSYDRPTPPPVISTGKAYEELEGAQGREVYFRPMRYRPDRNPMRWNTASGVARTMAITARHTRGA